MNHLALSIEAIHAGNGPKALELISNAMTHLDSSTFAFAFLWRGYILREHFKDHDSSLKDYDKSLEYDPLNERTFFQRGTLFETSFDCPESALKDYERAVQLKPDYVAALNNRGAIYRDLHKDYLRALKDFEDVISLRPEFPNGYAHKGLVLLLMGRMYEAEEFVNKSLSLEPKYSFGHYVKGLVQQHQGQYEEATSSLNTFLSLNPHKTRYRKHSVKTLEELKKKLEAKKHDEESKH